MIILNCAFNKRNGKIPMYETFTNLFNSNKEKNPGAVIFYIFVIFIVIFAIILAVRCNPNNQLAYGLIAFLFSEIYLIQFFIRKYIIQEKNYCSGIL